MLQVCLCVILQCDRYVTVPRVTVPWVSVVCCRSATVSMADDRGMTGRVSVTCVTRVPPVVSTSEVGDRERGERGRERERGREGGRKRETDGQTDTHTDSGEKEKGGREGQRGK